MDTIAAPPATVAPASARRGLTWPLERILFAAGGNDDRPQRPARRLRQSLVPAADRVRRPNQLAFVAFATAGASLVLGTYFGVRRRATDERPGPDRAARPLRRHCTVAPSSSPGP